MKSMSLQIVWNLVIRESLYTGIFFKFHDLWKFMYVKFIIPEVKKFHEWVDSRKFQYLKYYNILTRWFPWQFTIF